MTTAGATTGCKDHRATIPRDQRRPRARAERAHETSSAAARAPGLASRVRAKTIGSKLAVVPRAHGDTTPRPVSPWIAEQVQRLALACGSMSVGFRACAKHTRNEALAALATAMASEQASLADEAVRIGAALGVPLRRPAGMSECLRWEWLASTATLLDGSSDVRLLAECLRWMRAACDASHALELVSSHGARELSSDVQSITVALDRARGDVVALAPQGGQRVDGVQGAQISPALSV